VWGDAHYRTEAQESPRLLPTGEKERGVALRRSKRDELFWKKNEHSVPEVKKKEKKNWRGSCEWSWASGGRTTRKESSRHKNPAPKAQKGKEIHELGLPGVTTITSNCQAITAQKRKRGDALEGAISVHVREIKRKETEVEVRQKSHHNWDRPKRKATPPLSWIRKSGRGGLTIGRVHNGKGVLRKAGTARTVKKKSPSAGFSKKSK